MSSPIQRGALSAHVTNELQNLVCAACALPAKFLYILPCAQPLKRFFLFDGARCVSIMDA